MASTDSIWLKLRLFKYMSDLKMEVIWKWWDTFVDSDHFDTPINSLTGKCTFFEPKHEYDPCFAGLMAEV